jgi:hypothetical protein
VDKHAKHAKCAKRAKRAKRAKKSAHRGNVVEKFRDESAQADLAQLLARFQSPAN